MANRNTNPGSGKDDNEMRIQFGMILSSLRRRRINENMIRTDSQDYGADEILYIARTALFDKINRLMREITILFGVSPQLFRGLSPVVIPSCSQLFKFRV